MMIKIFNSKTVVGLFDNDQAVEQAVSRLQELGFGEKEDAIQIIDQHRLAQEAPVKATAREAVPQPGSGIAAAGPAAAFNPISEGGEAKAIERSIFEFLIDQGLSDEEARFFSQHTTAGGKLVVIETTRERAGHAEGAMKEASAKISTD
jgi:hypothetical protein